MRKLPRVFVLFIAFAVAGCLGSGGGGSKKATRDTTPEVNRSPTIEGSPPRSILAGEPYTFSPTAADPDGDTLVFQIAGKPAWAAFDPASGRLSGTPGAGDAGTFPSIRISVTDGRASAALAVFDIAVTQVASGSVTLSWSSPNRNSDGTSLTNLAGFRIYYGRNPEVLDQTVHLSNPGLTRYVVENLSPALWHFAMTSVNSKGKESKRSQIVSKNVA
jgi:hypothetical protein